MTSQRNAGAVHYRVRWRPRGTNPGSSAGTQAGGGHLLRALVPLHEHPDPRRLDLRSSLRDPLQRLWVRDFHQQSALRVVVLLDLSASMGYVGTVSRLAVARDIASALSIAAWRAGDAFGLYAAHAKPVPAMTLPTRVNRGAWLWIQRAFEEARCVGDSARGLLDLTARLPARRALVFVVSDFRWPEGLLRQVLGSLRRHQVVPLLLRDPTEAAEFPRRGITLLRDAETGAERFVWLRKALTDTVQVVRARHLESVKAACRMSGCRPFIVDGAFDPLALTRHLSLAGP